MQMQVGPYHTNKDPSDPVYHIYNDCPAGEHLTRDGNRIEGSGGITDMCRLCKKKKKTGKF
jgi:hypothetical protein